MLACAPGGMWEYTDNEQVILPKTQTLPEFVASVNPRTVENSPQRVKPQTPKLLQVSSEPEVEHFIRRYQTAQRSSLLTTLGRRQVYEAMVRKVFLNRGLPLDLINIAHIESNFRPRAESPTGARGMWQFIKSTAVSYGLRVGIFRDDRIDVKKETIAAAKHLSDLYHQFQDWYLAIAAYNGGAGHVRSAIRKAGSRDFFVLSRKKVLKKETRNYVSRFLALTAILHFPEEFGFRELSLKDDRLDLASKSGIGYLSFSTFQKFFFADHRKLLG